MGVPFFSGDGFVLICQVGAVTALGAVAGIVVLRRFVGRFLRLSPMQMAVALSAICIATVSAQKSGTNVVEETEGTNGVSEVGGTNTTDNADGETPPPLMMMFGGGNPAFSPDEPGLVVSLVDAARGYRLESVSTNEAISYEAPDDATEVGAWHLTGAYEDVQRVSFASHPSSPIPHPFLFPLGTNLCESLWAYTWGKVRPQLKNASNELVAVGSPMSALPGVSRFWTAHTTNDTFLLTWENFAVGRVSGSVREGADETVNAQLELYRNGDFIARSNSVESVYSRVNPDDLDNDGWLNEVDANPLVFNEDGFGPHQDYPGDLNTDHFCWLDLVVSNGNALVTFAGDMECDLADPKFMAKVGETNRVHILIGKRYIVHCDMPIFCVGREDPEIEVWGDEHDMDILWPVYMEFESLQLLTAGPRLGASSSGGVSPKIWPRRVRGGEFAWENSFCCSSSSASGTPIFNCHGDCGCGGCSTGDMTYHYSGYGLTFGGWSCSCPPKEDPGGPSTDEPGEDVPAGPSVSATFAKEAVIFEDAYENEPGVTVPRRSTDVEVEFYVYGGTNGGAYAFSIVNGDKLRHVGGDRLCEGTVGVGQSITIRARYEAVSASGSEGDIVAKAEFTENETGQKLSDEHSELTAVRVEIKAQVAAPENDCLNRHKFGVLELVDCIAVPTVPSLEWKCLAGGRVSGAASRTVYTCPIHSQNNGIRIECGGFSYSPLISVVQPNGVVARNVGYQDMGLGPGHAGGILLTMTLHALPLDVSFGRTMIEEIPDVGGSHSGYFADPRFINDWLHGDGQCAGQWGCVIGDNEFLSDKAGLEKEMHQLDGDGYVSNSGTNGWSNGTLTWDVPCGWSDTSAIKGDEPYGSFATSATQVMTIDAEGNCQVMKHGNSVRRNITGQRFLNGEPQ